MNRGTAERPKRVVHGGGTPRVVEDNDWQLDEAGGQRGREGMPYNHNHAKHSQVVSVLKRKINRSENKSFLQSKEKESVFFS